MPQEGPDDRLELLRDIYRTLTALAESTDEVARYLAWLRNTMPWPVTAGAPAPPQRYLSQRWPLRDGDSYGIVQAQPPVPPPSPDPPSEPEPKEGRLDRDDGVRP